MKTWNTLSKSARYLNRFGPFTWIHWNLNHPLQTLMRPMTFTRFTLKTYQHTILESPIPPMPILAIPHASVTSGCVIIIRETNSATIRNWRISRLQPFMNFFIQSSLDIIVLSDYGSWKQRPYGVKMNYTTVSMTTTAIWLPGFQIRTNQLMTKAATCTDRSSTFSISMNI